MPNAHNGPPIPEEEVLHPIKHVKRGKAKESNNASLKLFDVYEFRVKVKIKLLNYNCNNHIYIYSVVFQKSSVLVSQGEGQWSESN